MPRGRPRKNASPPPPRDVTKDDNSAQMKTIVADITRLLDEGESKKGEYMAWWKRQRELINGHYDRAANSGYSKKVIKAIIKARELEKKLDDVRDDLADDDLVDSYDAYRVALGDFADTPLGAASAPKQPAPPVGVVDDDDDDDRDLRPRHLRENEAQRVAEENAAALEAGIKPLPN